ncbi:MAG: hypothetical protein IJL60_07845 [Clostridiales bacterium]|nr:hypothetical protein [Clostridiales bacterium]
MSESQATPSNVDLNLVTPYTPTEDQLKKYTSAKTRGAWNMLFGSIALLLIIIVLAVLFISVFHVIVYSIKIIFGLLIVLIFPIYAIYDLIKTYSNLKKKNYSFYSSVITDNVENGYLVQGITSSGISFIDKSDADAKKAPGTPVIVAVMKDEIDLLGM